MAKDNSAALAEEINPAKIRQLQTRIDANSVIIEGIINKLVSSYCKQLDEYILYIRNILADVDNPPTDIELDDMALNIPVSLYFTGEGQESLGVKEDIAKAIKMELYNETYDKASGTIADRTAVAELATQNEFLAHIAYQRAYKKIKLRMEAGNEILQSVKKVISRRMQGYELSRIDPERIGGA